MAPTRNRHPQRRMRMVTCSGTFSMRKLIRTAAAARRPHAAAAPAAAPVSAARAPARTAAAAARTAALGAGHPSAAHAAALAGPAAAARAPTGAPEGSPRGLGCPWRRWQPLPRRPPGCARSRSRARSFHGACASRRRSGTPASWRRAPRWRWRRPRRGVPATACRAAPSALAPRTAQPAATSYPVLRRRARRGSGWQCSRSSG
mmetsp:Transcript_166910/g.535801  ORF Transcript_166910/g.535801 Transcript_166910/m.535801 type:complete len:204 (+) Transcript_166910:408-1019(+)